MPAVSTSGHTDHTMNRDDIISRALRICGYLGEGETASANAITEGATALNDMTKAWSIEDGMPLWKVRLMTGIAYTANTNSYTIGIGATSNQEAPLRIYQAFNRDTSVTPNRDIPMMLIAKQDYMYLNQKAQTGSSPTQLMYDPPGANVYGPVSESRGTITVYPTPDATAAANLQLMIVAQLPYEDFNASTDVPDFPNTWYNAIVWGLAAELAYEKGVGLAERSMISKRAADHRDEARLGGAEEGSVFIRPTVQYNSPGGGPNQ